MIREYRVRVAVMRDGAEATELHPVSAPVVDCNSEAVIKMSMSGMFLANPNVNWLTDELQPIQIIDGVEYPVGVFPVGTFSENVDENGATNVMVEAFDRCMILNQIKTQGILHLPAGTNYLQAIEQLLVDAGISLYLSTPTTAVLATDREDWEVGTPYLTIINELLREINYGQIWFNASGFAMLQPAKKPLPDNIDHQYGAEGEACEQFKVLERPCRIETDIFDAHNVFVVICSNPDLEQPLIATAVNDNPLSALSTFKRGRKIVGVYRVDNVPDQATLDEYAQKLCTESMLTAETVTISTANVPNHGVYDTIALVHPDAFGLYQEVSWSLVLEPGQSMIHHIRRSVLV